MLLERWPDLPCSPTPTSRRRPHRRDRPGDTIASATSTSRSCTPRATPRGCWRPRRGQRVPRRHDVQELGGRRARPRERRPTTTSSTRSWTCCSRSRPRRVRPGHTEPSTVAEEWETNRFVRVWRGLDPEGTEQCTAMGDPATLVLLGDDYDGGHKAWVRWPDGRDDIVPGSQVQPDAAASHGASIAPTPGRSASARPRGAIRRASNRSPRGGRRCWRP